MKKIMCLMLGALMAVMLMLTACSTGQTERKQVEHQYEMENEQNIETMLLYGFVGERFSKNEENWLEKATALNPYMLESFKERETNMWSNQLMSWFGEFPGKLLTSIAYSYRMSRDSDLLIEGNYIVDKLVEYQADDGYLGVFKTQDRFSQGERETWDLWNHYHIALGLYFWYVETGSDKAAELAISMLDYVIDFFSGVDDSGADKGERYIKLRAQDINYAMSHGYMLWYNLVKNDSKLSQKYSDNVEKYYAEAKKIVDVEWTRSWAGDWYNLINSGKEFYQSRKPRWEPLHCLMTLAELYKADKENNEHYYKAFEKLYFSILKTDIHNSGSFSSNEAAVGNPYADKVVETCCTIAWAEMSIVYLQLSHNSIVADELERTLLNAGLGSQLSTNDFMYYTYSTPAVGVKETAINSLHWQALSGCIDVSCCQMNAGKIPALFGQYGYIKDYEGENSDIYINYYGESKTNIKTKSGQILTITQETDYPVSGQIKLKLNIDSQEELSIKLRIPVWSQNSSVKYNSENAQSALTRSYHTLTKSFSDGDVIIVNLDMSAHYWQGENQYTDYVSVYHGPVLLAHDQSSNIYPNIRRQWKIDDFNDKVVTKGENSMLIARVNDASGEAINLIDFASAGVKELTYYSSWFKADRLNVIAPNGQNCVWNNRP